MRLNFQGLTTEQTTVIRQGGPDAYGNAAKLSGVSSGNGVPCRHCLAQVPEGHAMLELAWKPFDGMHAYTETGPIFLCADDCQSGAGDAEPPVLTASPDYLVKAYSADERIIYGTGAIIPKGQVRQRAETLLEDAKVAFVDVRSAKNNCFLARITRA